MVEMRTDPEREIVRPEMELHGEEYGVGNVPELSWGGEDRMKCKSTTQYRNPKGFDKPITFVCGLEKGHLGQHEFSLKWFD